MAADDGNPWALNGRRQTLAARALLAAAADKRVAELEHELDQARERLTHQLDQAREQLTYELDQAREQLTNQQNRAASLETSFALRTDENARLLQRMTELTADLERKHNQLEHARLALAAAASERIKTEEQNQAEISARDRELALVSARAESAEKLLEQIQERLRTSESEIERLRGEQVESIAEQWRLDTALANAKHTITALGNLFWQLELTVQRQCQDGLTPQATTQSIAAECSSGSSITSRMLQRDLGKDAWLFGSLQKGRA